MKKIMMLAGVLGALSVSTNAAAEAPSDENQGMLNQEKGTELEGSVIQDGGQCPIDQIILDTVLDAAFGTQATCANW